jgi:hypothetical protein
MNKTLTHFRRPLTASEKAILEGGYWHCTNPANFRRIVRSGAILPNLGRFPAQHGLSPQSKCALAGGVSLFEPWQAKSRSWLLMWLGTHQPLSVALRLDPAMIRPQARLREDLPEWPGGIMLRGEACVCAPIPLEYCTGLLLIAAPKRREARWIEPFDWPKASAALREMCSHRKIPRKAA